MKISKSNKKMIAVAIAFAVVLILIIVMLFTVKNMNKKPVSEETTEAYHPQWNSSETENVSNADTSVTLPTTSPAMSQQNGNETKDIEAFLSGHYYLSGTLSSNGSDTSADFAVDGSDLQMSMDYEGMKMSILYLGGKLYIINTEKNTYMNMSAALMSMVGMSESDIKDMVAELDMSKLKFTGVDRAETTLNGKEAVLYNYRTADNIMQFYLIGGELKQIDTMSNSDGKVTDSIQINSFSSVIPSNMLTTDGYKKETSMMSFFAAFAQ